MTILFDAKIASPDSPLSLDLHITTALHITPAAARRLVNRRLVPKFGTGVTAGEPELMIVGEWIAWRVPLVLSLPQWGELGQIGAVAVEAHTGKLLLEPEAKQRIINHARRLYIGATLQAK